METKTGKLITNKLSLPLFMVSRIRLKEPQPLVKLKNYINKRKPLYLSSFSGEKETDSGSFNLRKYQHILGSDKAKPRSHCEVKYSRLTGSSSTDKSWQLAPNRYCFKSKPFESKSGLKGAHWHKLHKTKARKINAQKPTYRLYDLPRETEKMDRMCHSYKSQFLSNARERRPTTRGMIENPLTAYRDANEPGPSTYKPKEPTNTYETTKPCRPNPHIFYRKSVVPLKANFIHPQHISFCPGPGRYETRYRNICPCSNRLKYQPELDLLAEREKRQKFRRLPYTKLKTHLYCSPDWRHVKGSGFRRLFQGSTPQKRTVTADDEAKNKSKLVKLYHEAKYMNMIINPQHDPGTIRKQPVPQLPTRITYNSMIKVISRKQLRINRKLAFNSCVERWPDSDRPAVLTSQQLRELKEKLPPERRIRDLPVMVKRGEEITSKLLETPPHMLPNYVPKLRKRLFKFLPLPAAKILIGQADIRPVAPATHGYFLRTLDEKLFFKESKK